MTDNERARMEAGQEHTEGVETWLARIEEAAGEEAASADSPCGVCAYYDVGAEKPWRVSDDWHSESFGTPGEAMEAARTWGAGR